MRDHLIINGNSTASFRRAKANGWVVVIIRIDSIVLQLCKSSFDEFLLLFSDMAVAFLNKTNQGESEKHPLSGSVAERMADT